MLILTMLVFGILLVLVFAWMFIWKMSNDYSISKQPLPHVKSALAVFPHPDDESLTCSGLLYDLAIHGTKTNLVIFTKGERGVEGAIYTPTLKDIREKEIKKSARAIKINKLYLYDYGDGQLDTKSEQIFTLLADLIDKINPDLVITYDQSGLYGHPDHIVVSKLLTQLIIKKPRCQLWYVSRPQKVYDRMNLPIHMATDPNFINKRTFPSHRIRLSFKAMTAKINSLYAHKSQHFAFKKSRQWLPLWFWASTQTDEYFYHKKLKTKTVK